MVIFSLTLFSLCGVARAVAGAFLDNYDTPLYSKTGNAPGQDEEVFCTFYNGFMVKQEWYVGIGGSEPTGPVDVVPEQGNKTTRCDDATAPGQLQAPVDPNSEASLDGVLGSYIFLSAPTAVGNQIYVFQASSRALAASGPWFIAGPRNTWRNPLWTMLPGGLDLWLTTEVQVGCSVMDRGSESAACVANLAKAAGAPVSLDMCLKSLGDKPVRLPTAAIYPALLSLRGDKATLRATGPADGCTFWIH